MVLRRLSVLLRAPDSGIYVSVSAADRPVKTIGSMIDNEIKDGQRIKN